ncbi:MAG TPA: RidA family protein [Vicinamibacterales bacterium]|nr:RidA family protein [Vicinamibacterales bacterium]
MRPCSIVTGLALSVAALSAQSGKQFVRPPAGQTPPYSLAIKAGGVIYTAGQLPTDASGNVVSGDITAQAKQVFANLRGVLQQAGSSLDNAVSAIVMLQNASDFAALDQVYRDQFKGEPPARTTFVGSMVRPGALLEIQITAVPGGAERKVILPPGWTKPTSPYNYAIQSGDTVWMSGLVSRSGANNTQVQGDIAVQTKTIMDNAGAILKAAGMSYGDLVAGRVALRDMANFQPMNDVYRTYWEKDRPARVSCQAAPPGTFDVEITFTAVKGSSPREVIIPARADGTPGQAGPNFSPAIKVGNRLFISGGTGATAANATDMKAQTAETLTRFGPALKAAGFDYKDVVAADVFVTDVQKFNEMNDGYRPAFPTDPPVRATVGIGKLAGQTALVEIMVTAVK